MRRCGVRVRGHRRTEWFQHLHRTVLRRSCRSASRARVTASIKQFYCTWINKIHAFISLQLSEFCILYTWPYLYVHIAPKLLLKSTWNVSLYMVLLNLERVHMIYMNTGSMIYISNRFGFNLFKRPTFRTRCYLNSYITQKTRKLVAKRDNCSDKKHIDKELVAEGRQTDLRLVTTAGIRQSRQCNCVSDVIILQN